MSLKYCIVCGREFHPHNEDDEACADCASETEDDIELASAGDDDDEG